MLKIKRVNFSLLLASLMVVACNCFADQGTGAKIEEVLRLVNEEREKYGVPSLILDQELLEGANIRARELPDSYSHTRPDGTNCFTVLRYHNAYKGENIAAGYVYSKDAMDAWMNSPGHRANILSKDFTKLGIGYYYKENSGYKHFWVQMFLGPDI